MRSISSSSRSMSVSRSFSTDLKRSVSHHAYEPPRKISSSSESRSKSRQRRRQSDSRGSSSRSYSPPRRRYSSDSSDSLSRSRSRSRSRRRRASHSWSSSSRSYDSSRSHGRRSRSFSRSRRTRHYRRHRSISEDSRSNRYRRRSTSARRRSPPQRRNRNRSPDDRRNNRHVIKDFKKTYRSRHEAERLRRTQLHQRIRGANRAPVNYRTNRIDRALSRREALEKKIDAIRRTQTPFLLPIYAITDDSVEMKPAADEDQETFQQKLDASVSVEKLELYIWPDNTLRDLVGLVKDLCQSARGKEGIWTFQLNKKTRAVLGEIHSFKWSESSDSITLRNTPFHVGDSLLLFFRGVPIAPEADTQTAP